MTVLASSSRSIVCGFCGLEFMEDRGQPTCRACPLGGGCPMIRCPTCGYENLAPPGWIARLFEPRSAP